MYPILISRSTQFEALMSFARAGTLLLSIYALEFINQTERHRLSINNPHYQALKRLFEKKTYHLEATSILIARSLFDYVEGVQRAIGPLAGGIQGDSVPLNAQSRIRNDDLRVTNYAAFHSSQSTARHNNIKISGLRSD